MPESFDIIRARVKDDAPVLIDRLLKSRHGEVVLVLPKNSIIAANLNSLRILQQEAESIGKVLSVSTDNRDIKDFAEALRISIYNPTAQPAEKKPAVAETTNVRPKRRVMDIVPPIRRIRGKEEVFETPPLFENPAPEQFNPIEDTQEASRAQETPVYEVKSEMTENQDLEKNLEDFYAEPKNEHPSSGGKRRYFSYNRGVAALAVFATLSFAAAMYLVLPSANINISINKLPLKAAVPVAVSKNVSSSNLASGIIPGQYFLLSKSGSKTFSVEGESKELFAKASGYIDIYNAYGATPQRLVAQTRFETKDGKIFKIQKAVVVPGAKMSGNNLTPSSIRVEVLADQAGDEYNIGPSFFTIPGFKGTPKYAGFYAKSAEPMVAGKIGTGKQVTAGLIEKAKNDLAGEFVKELEADTLNTLKDSDLRLIDGASAVKIDEFKSSAAAGAVADSLTITMKITWQALVFKEKDFGALVANFIVSKYPEAKDLNFEGGIVYPKATKADFKKGELFFIYDIDEENIMAVKTDELRKELAGRDESEIRDLISGKTFISGATISFWPIWVNRAPDNPKKITITIDKE